MVPAAGPGPMLQAKLDRGSDAPVRDRQTLDEAGAGEAEPSVDPPRAGIYQPAFIDHDDGSNLRTGPAELGGRALTPQPLPPATRLFVSGQHPRAPAWWYVSVFLPDTLLRGYVQAFRVTTDLPEPSAKLYPIQPGDTVEKLAAQEFAAHVREGHDLRYYENVLLVVNQDKGRKGIHGTFQDPRLLGGGANHIQLEAGRRIWLVSPAYARALAGKVPSGSLTGGGYAKAQRVLGHLEDIVSSVTNSPRYFGPVAGQYAEALREHLPEIIGITAGFILAESASAFLAATPTGVGQLAAVMIQLALAAFGAQAAVDAGVQALAHGQQWLTLAWTAQGDALQLGEASKEFLKMLVSVAIAALSLAGMKGNIGKGMKIAEAIKIQPPSLGWSPAMATAEGAVIGGGPVFTPGRISSTGPVNISPSLTTGTGYGAHGVQTSYDPASRTDVELQKDLDPTPRSGETPLQAKDRANAAKTEIEWRQARGTYNGLGDKPPKINITTNDATHPDAHTIERHGPQVPLRRSYAPGQRTIEGRIYGDPPWPNAEKYSYRWLDESLMNRTVNEHIQANWENIRSDLALDPAAGYSATFDVGHAVGEGFRKDGANAVYGKTSTVTIRIKLVLGNPPTIEIRTEFPNGRGF